MATTVRRELDVNASAERVWALITDPLRMPAWLPGLQEVRDVRGTSVDLRWEWTFRMAGLLFDGRTEVRSWQPPSRFVNATSGGIPSTWDWTLHPGGGRTRLALAVTYEVPIPGLGKVAERLLVHQNERVADQAIQRIRALVEG